MVFLYHATQGTKPCQGFIANVTSYVSEVGVRVLRECYDEGGDRRRGGQAQPERERDKNRMHEGRQQNTRRQIRGPKPQEIGDKGRQSMRSRRLLTIKPKEPEAPRRSIYKKQMREKHKLKLRNKCLKQ